MTLNITAANPWFVAQVSDRRLTWAGRPYDDEANKVVVLGCRDALLLVTYTGLGYVDELRTDDWIAEVLDANKVVRRDMGFAVEVLRQAATEAFSRLGEPDRGAAHTFLLAGWHPRRKRQIPYIWMVSNCQDLRNGRFGCVRERFEVQYVRMARDARPDTVALVVWTGAEAAADRAELARLRGALFGARDPESATAAMVTMILRAADHPEYGRYIGRDCMVAIAPREGMGDVDCYYVGLAGGRVAYTPQIVAPGIVLRACEVTGGDLTVPAGGRAIRIRGSGRVPGGPLFGLRSQRTPPRPL